MRISALGTALALGLLAAGCVNLRREFPVRQTFALAAAPAAAGPVATAPGTALKIRPLRAVPPYQGKEFIYRRSDVRYEADFYNGFLVPPATLITTELRKTLAAPGRFERVVDAASALRTTHALEGALTALYGDYRRKDAPRAVLELTLTLLDNSATTVFWQATYTQAVVIANATPETLVNGWNTALGAILTAVQKDLQKAPLTEKSSAP